MRPVAFRTAGVRVDLHHPSGPTRELVKRVGAAMLARDGRTEPPGVVIDGPAVLSGTVEPSDAAAAAARLLAAVEQAALAWTVALPIHALAVAGPAGAVVLPGRSGAGKSTLAAAVLQRGLALVSDEAACFAEPTGVLVPHPRPLHLSLHSRRLLGVTVAPGVDEEVGLPVELFGSALAPEETVRCVGVLLLQRETGTTARLVPAASRGAALAALLSGRLRSSPSARHRGPQGWPDECTWLYLSRLVGEAWVGTLVYDDPQAGAGALADALTNGWPPAR